MKKLFYLLILSAILPLVSCNTEYEKEQTIYRDVPATLDEIQGSWRCVKNGVFYIVTFDEDYYEINSELHMANTDKTLSLEYGTYTMDEDRPILRLKPYLGSSSFTPLEVYWTDSDRALLQIIPMGTFQRYTKPEVPEAPETPETPETPDEE